MSRPPPRTTRTYPPFPYTTLCRSAVRKPGGYHEAVPQALTPGKAAAVIVDRQGFAPPQIALDLVAEHVRTAIPVGLHRPTHFETDDLGHDIVDFAEITLQERRRRVLRGFDDRDTLAAQRIQKAFENQIGSANV